MLDVSLLLHFTFLAGGSVKVVENNYKKCKKEKEFVTNEENLLIFKHCFTFFNVVWC